jgi:hypothetical protein
MSAELQPPRVDREHQTGGHPEALAVVGVLQATVGWEEMPGEYWSHGVTSQSLPSRTR